MGMQLTIERSRDYIVTIFLNVNKRYGIRHPSGMIHKNDYASYRYTRKVCLANDWIVNPGNHEKAL